jgi:hypothetical protein
MAVNRLAQNCCEQLNFLLVLTFLFLLDAMNSLDPQLRDFILFCVDRRGADWPAIYDEMAGVAGQHLFRGLGRTELKQLGLSLALDGLDETIELVKQAMAQDQQA